MSTSVNLVSSELFIQKLKELVEAGKQFGTLYDIGRDRVVLQEQKDGYIVAWESPITSDMSNPEYYSFRRAIDEALPEAHPAIGQFY